MTLDFSWVELEHRDKAAELVPILTETCVRATRSKRFIDMQLNPRSEWKGWPEEVAEAWIAKRPAVLFKYLEGQVVGAVVAKALMARLQDAYRPSTGRPVGRPPREPLPGLDVPEAVSRVLDSVTWTVMRKFGGRPDQTSFVQAAKVAAVEDSDTERAAMVLSVGTVKGSARKARYTSIRGDLYWGDVRNGLELWIRSHPELLDQFREWDARGRPRAWEEGGMWVARGSQNRREHNPLILIKATAHKRARDLVSRWARDGHLSLDAILDGPGEQGLRDLQKPLVERTQHKPKPGHEHYAWGLRDDVDCYSFPVESRQT